MLKLYKLSNEIKEYWETWDNGNGSHTVHWGELGTIGNSKTVKSAWFKKAETIIQKEIDALVAQGFHPIDEEDHTPLLIEYKVEEMGNSKDVEKRHRLENLMNETLGWTGLGACDGGGIGSGTMEVCNYVVDFEVAENVIKKALVGTEFSDYTRIYYVTSNLANP